MRIFMLGWEFPPFITGGLGTACHGLTKAMSHYGFHITFVLPKAINNSCQSQDIKMLGFDLDDSSVNGVSKDVTRNYRKKLSDKFSGQVTFKGVNSTIYSPYADKIDSKSDVKNVYQSNYSWQSKKYKKGESDFLSSAHRYAKLCAELAANENFDIIHAHDWFTFPAGIAVAKATNKPLVVHVHSTEFDRAGNQGNKQIMQIENDGVGQADRVIAVSNLTKQTLLEHYNLDEKKIDVVHNGIELCNQNGQNHINKKNKRRKKLVLFLGRITMQKGPEYFLAAAKKVLEKYSNVKFVVAGSGDRMESMIEQVARDKLGADVLFTGFLNTKDVQRAFQMADVYVMPSVSEPFGIAPLEAISNHVPVIVSKTAGVGEVLNHVLKVDFWDINLMAEKIISVLKHPPLSDALCENAYKDVAKLTWDAAAMNCLDVYLRAIKVK